ncbi:glycosyl transferase GTB-type super family [Candidatus Termititenax aidoneus]|uniref:Glycosyl transferase GTB-type super family n=1 Tax=Termititenax aidoneus TaxID=2218524 RepID=A0A388TE90_TERA1|nr:glycosyl transferase GTB-type super family [Candidatus Termititenax aidoneus]
MLIALYLDNSPFKDIDVRGIGREPLGINGTAFAALVLIHYLTKMYVDIRFILLSPYRCFLDNNKVQNIIVRDAKDAAQKAKESLVDILIINKYDIIKAHKTILELKLPTITWGENFYYKQEADLITNNEYVRANVFVGRQQYDRYIDDMVSLKSTFIYNIMPSEYLPLRAPTCGGGGGGGVVAYMGALVPAKGFHILASVWRDVLKEMPDAKLKVLGSHRLYDRDAVLGRYGLAEKEYEERFIPHLLNNNGKLLDSVRFYGVVGKEKYEILKNAAVGIPNPSGISETFCYCAVEMQAMGVPVVSIADYGLLDTIKNRKTGLLYKGNIHEFKQKIVKLLKDKELNNKLGFNGRRFVRENFSAEKLVPQWYRLLQDVLNNRRPQFIWPRDQYFKHKKWKKLIVRFLYNCKIIKYMSGLTYETCEY